MDVPMGQPSANLSGPVDVPVTYFVFNRPDLVRRSLASLVQAAPRRLFVVAFFFLRRRRGGLFSTSGDVAGKLVGGLFRRIGRNRGCAGIESPELVGGECFGVSENAEDRIMDGRADDARERQKET